MQTDKNQAAATTTDKMAETIAVNIKARVRQEIKNNIANIVACGLALIALVSFFFPEEWSGFGHALQAVCFAGALAVIFVCEFQKLIATLKTLRGGNRREVVLCVIAGLLLLAGTCALVLATYSPDNGLAFALRVVGLILFAFAIATITWAFVLRARNTWRIVRIYRKLKATDDEAELKALCAEIDRINRES